MWKCSFHIEELTIVINHIFSIISSKCKMPYEYNLNEKKQKTLKKDCTLGEQLKYHKISKGIKVPEMIKILHISRSCLVSLEENRKRVKFDVNLIKDYINALELNIDDLIGAKHSCTTNWETKRLLISKKIMRN